MAKNTNKTSSKRALEGDPKRSPPNETKAAGPKQLEPSIGLRSGRIHTYESKDRQLSPSGGTVPRPPFSVVDLTTEPEKVPTTDDLNKARKPRASYSSVVRRLFETPPASPLPSAPASPMTMPASLASPRSEDSLVSSDETGTNEEYLVQEELQSEEGGLAADEWKTLSGGSPRWQKAKAGRAAAQDKLKAAAVSAARFVALEDEESKSEGEGEQPRAAIAKPVDDAAQKPRQKKKGDRSPRTQLPAPLSPAEREAYTFLTGDELPQIEYVKRPDLALFRARHPHQAVQRISLKCGGQEHRTLQDVFIDLVRAAVKTRTCSSPIRATGLRKKGDRGRGLAGKENAAGIERNGKEANVDEAATPALIHSQKVAEVPDASGASHGDSQPAHLILTARGRGDGAVAQRVAKAGQAKMSKSDQPAKPNMQLIDRATERAMVAEAYGKKEGDLDGDQCEEAATLVRPPWDAQPPTGAAGMRRPDENESNRPDAVPLGVGSAMADSGCGRISVIGSQLVDELPRSAVVEWVRQPTKGHPALVGPDGKSLLVLGRAVIMFTIDGYAYRHTFQVVEGGQLMLLGNDFLVAHDGVIDVGRNEVTLNHRRARGGRLVARLAVSVSPKSSSERMERLNDAPSVKLRPGRRAAAAAAVNDEAHAASGDAPRGRDAALVGGMMPPQAESREAEQSGETEPAECLDTYCLAVYA